jgi:regulatory protein
MPFRRRTEAYIAAELYEYAVGALGRRMRTVAELKRLLRQRLARQQNAEVLVEAVIQKLKEQGYLNDAQYATAYSSLRRENQKFGRRRVITDLKTKGVHGDIIETTVAQTYAGVDEEQLARDFLARKRLAKPADQKEAAKVFRALLRAGFATRTIVRILKNWDVEDEVITALESADAEWTENPEPRHSERED